MRSLIVPVSFSSLLFPTVAPGCSDSFLSFSFFALDGCGSDVGGFWGSGCCAKAGEATAHSPINNTIDRLCRSLLCLLMVSRQLSPEALYFGPVSNRIVPRIQGSQ